MKSGWEKKTLKEVTIKIGSGATPLGGNKSYKRAGITLVRSMNVHDQYFKEKNLAFIDDEQAQELNNVIVQENDILFNITGASVARCCLISKKYLPARVNQHVSIIRSQHKIIDPFFLNLLLTSKFYKNRLLLIGDQGSTRQAITKSQLENFIISYPKSIFEQQQIVATLDKAFAKIDKIKANIEQNIENTKEFFESYLQSIFSNKSDNWEHKTLKQVSDIFERGKSKHRPRNDKKLYGGDYPFIQTGDIRNCDHYILEYTQSYNELGLAQSKLWPTGTICITIAANIAETGILTFDACFPDSIIGVVVNNKLADRDFVKYLLRLYRTRLQSLSKGSAQANINMGTFKNELFPFPKIEEQKAIVQKLNIFRTTTKKLEALYRQKLDDLEKLKKSILQQAFNGELKIDGRND